FERAQLGYKLLLSSFGVTCSILTGTPEGFFPLFLAACEFLLDFGKLALRFSQAAFCVSEPAVGREKFFFSPCQGQRKLGFPLTRALGEGLQLVIALLKLTFGVHLKHAHLLLRLRVTDPYGSQFGAHR